MKPGSALIAGLMLFGMSGVANAGFESPSSGPSTTKNPFSLKPWDLEIRVVFGYNDNVNFVSDGDPLFSGETGSPYFTFTVNGVYRFLETGNWTLGVAARFDKTLHTDKQNPEMPAVNDDQTRYNVFAVSPSIFMEHRFSLSGKPGTARASYTFTYEDGRIDSINAMAHMIDLGVDVMLRRDVQVGVSYTHSWNDFSVKIVPLALNDRDSNYDKIALSARKWFHGRARSISASVGYVSNDADGSNFEYDGVAVSVELTSQIYGPVWGTVTFGYSGLDYGGFVPPPTRKHQDIYSIGPQVLWVINPFWTADVFFTHIRYNSNHRLYEGERNIGGIGITRRF